MLPLAPLARRGDVYRDEPILVERLAEWGRAAFDSQVLPELQARVWRLLVERGVVG
ncbi:MAG TPA: hypothetical protein VGF39_09580 [Stellaceae bacterium]|jgi:hypothetical protein